MKPYYWSLLSACIILFVMHDRRCKGADEPVSMRPAILIIFDDLHDIVDQRDLHGVTIQTPNFDRLKQKAVRFSNAFASIAVCNPSRSSFMTGQSPFRTGIHVPEPTQWNQKLPRDATVVSAMRQSGYRTLSSGKVFHNQTRADDQALFNAIFDQNYQSFDRLELPAGQLSHASSLPQADDFHVQWASEQLQRYQATFAEDQLVHDAPLFLSVGIIRPHRPFIAPQQFFDLYPRELLGSNLQTVNTEDLDDVSQFYKRFRLLQNYHDQLISSDDAVEFIQGYLASISYADSLLGSLIDAIESNPSLADASIIVTSDNGYQLGEKSTWNKFTLWEESAKVPMYLIDPALNAGTDCDVPVSLLDIAPTLTGVANGPPLPLFDGHDLRDIALNARDYADREVITTMIGSLSIRSKQFRMMLYNDGSVELYDVILDPRERTNLSALPEYQSVVQNLTTSIEELVRQQGGKIVALTNDAQSTPLDDTIFVIGNQVGAGANGDDVYFVADGGQILETEGGGFDTAYIADVDYDIPMGVESIVTSLYSNKLIYQINGNSEANLVSVRAARSAVHGGDGNDTILTGNARDFVDGGSGNDFILTTGGNKNQLSGGTGFDVIIGGDGFDKIRTGVTVEQLENGWVDSDDGDFVLGGDIYQLGEADRYLDNGDIEIAGRRIVSPSSLALLRRDGNFLIFGQRLEIGDGLGNLNTEFQLERLEQTLAQHITGDFFLIQEGAGDLIQTGRGHSMVFGQSGEDVITTGAGHDFVYSLDGDDVVTAQQGDDSIFSGAGNDTVDGGHGNNFIKSERGDDLIISRAGDDWIDSGEGADQIESGAGNDIIYARSGEDHVNGRAGDDFISGGDGKDVCFGGLGDDILSGNKDDDVLYGDAGNDRLQGGLGDDTLNGGKDNDILLGQAGDDFLKGGPGDDLLIGGKGADYFAFPARSGQDTVADFEPLVDWIIIPSESAMHALTDEQITEMHVFWEGGQTVIRDGTKSLSFRGQPSDLRGRLRRQEAIR